jgi:hypothetical protein
MMRGWVTGLALLVPACAIDRPAPGILIARVVESREVTYYTGASADGSISHISANQTMSHMVEAERAPGRRPPRPFSVLADTDDCRALQAGRRYRMRLSEKRQVAFGVNRHDDRRFFTYRAVSHCEPIEPPA